MEGPSRYFLPERGKGEIKEEEEVEDLKGVMINGG